MECKFEVGQQVYCITEFDKCPIRLQDPKVNVPVMGNIYTIREISASGNLIGLLLVEVVNNHYDFKDGRGEPYWMHNGFRPLKKTKFDSVEQLLVPLLNTTKENVNV